MDSDYMWWQIVNWLKHMLYFVNINNNYTTNKKTNNYVK
jgi:hypothetical protein